MVGPALERFAPEMVFVSAGYDAHWRDPLAGLQFRSATYHALVSRIKLAADRLCGPGRLMFCLEVRAAPPGSRAAPPSAFVVVLRH